MRFIKSYQIFESIDYSLRKDLEKHFIKNYIVNEDGSIDVNGDVIMYGKCYNKIPFLFNKISGCFKINDNNLISLKNCPKYIGDHFNCSYNKLESLEYGPEYVHTFYICKHNELETLKGCVEEVYGKFDCSYNDLTSLEFCPMQVEGEFDCSYNALKELDRSPFIRDNLYCKGMFSKEKHLDRIPEFSGYCKKLIF